MMGIIYLMPWQQVYNPLVYQYDKSLSEEFGQALVDR